MGGLLAEAGHLWFICVLRDRIGPGEDRFFATVFLGSGLVIVATFFAAEAVAAGLIDTAAVRGPWLELVPLVDLGGNRLGCCDDLRPDRRLRQIPPR
jgi:hypothetical protein